MTIDLWGDIPEPGKEKTPFTILWEQASLLQKKTKFLQGRVRRVKKSSTGVKRQREIVRGPFIENLEAADREISYMLDIVAPKLDYSFGVLMISYDIDKIYPVEIEPLVRCDDGEHDYLRDNFSCMSEDDFLDGLEDILASDEVKKVIQRLLAHISLERGDEQTDDESEE